MRYSVYIGSIKMTLTFFELLSSDKCPLSVAIAGMVSIALIAGPMSLLAAKFGLASPIYGMGILLLANFIVGKVAESFIAQCNG